MASRFHLRLYCGSKKFNRRNKNGRSCCKQTSVKSLYYIYHFITLLHFIIPSRGLIYRANYVAQEEFSVLLHLAKKCPENAPSITALNVARQPVSRIPKFAVLSSFFSSSRTTDSIFV